MLHPSPLPYLKPLKSGLRPATLFGELATEAKPARGDDILAGRDLLRLSEGLWIGGHEQRRRHLDRFGCSRAPVQEGDHIGFCFE